MSMNSAAPQRAILIHAKVCVRSLDAIGWKSFEGIKDDTRLSFYANGVHHVSVAIDLHDTIKPDSCGDAVFLMATRALNETGVKPGEIVELKSGLLTVATAEIQAMNDVLVFDDPRATRGYTIKIDDHRNN